MALTLPDSVRDLQLQGSAQPHPNRIQRGEQDAVLPTLWHRDHDDFVFCWNRRPPHHCDVAIHAAGSPAARQSTGSLIPGTRRSASARFTRSAKPGAQRFLPELQFRTAREPSHPQLARVHRRNARANPSNEAASS